jgi:hypothetical protein
MRLFIERSCAAWNFLWTGPAASVPPVRNTRPVKGLCNQTHNGNFVAKVKEKTMANKKFFAGMLAIALVFGLFLIGCPTDGGSSGGGGGGNVPDEIVGTWNDGLSGAEFFTITSAGKLKMSSGQGGQEYDISVSGKTVELKVPGVSTMGTFDYAIDSSGKMTGSGFTNGCIAYQSMFPLSKSGGGNGNGNGNGGNGGGSIPSDLVGKWKTSNGATMEINADGTGKMGSVSAGWSVSGNKLTVKQSGSYVGTVDYSVSEGKLSLTNPTSDNYSTTLQAYNGATKVAVKPTELLPTATAAEALEKLDQIIAYSPAKKSSAEDLKTSVSGAASSGTWSSTGPSLIPVINVLINSL